MVEHIEDIVDTVEMVDTVDMQVHNMFEPQLKIKNTTHLKQSGIVKFKQFLTIAFIQISTNLCI